MEEALHVLKYHPDWLVHGWLDKELIEEQLIRYHEGTDPNTEHYRYAAFKRVLRIHTALNNAMIDHYVKLTCLDPDVTMGESAYIDLLYWQGLTIGQLDRLEDHPAFPTPAVQKVFAQVRRRHQR